MKKGLIFTSASLVVAAFVFTASCKKAVSCANLVIDVSSAAAEYGSDSTKCKAYKEALTAWVSNTECSNADATTKAAYDAIITDLNTECP